MSKKMREKYGRGLVSKDFIETGVPTLRRERMAAAAKDMKKLDKQHEKALKKAEKRGEKLYRQQCKMADRTPAKNVVFI